MPASRTATLSSLLVSKKGMDTPRPQHPGLEAAQTPAGFDLAAAERDTKSGAAAQPAYYKALTLKVDRERFIKLKALGVQRDLRSQALMTEALDLLFAKHQP